MNMSPILPSQCRSVRGRFDRSTTADGQLATVAGGRPARSVRPARCRGVRVGRLDGAGENQRQPIANLVASTSGTDSDWVVKLIDVYPDEVVGQPAMGGYQLMVSADIFRGRYRESFETAKADCARTSLCSTGSPCPPQTTCFCPAIGSWCRSSRAGSLSTTAIRRPSCPTSSGPSRAITARPCNGSTTRPAKRASSNCL